MLYWETFDVLESLVDGEAKRMLAAIRQYSQYGVLPDFSDSAMLSTLWLLIRPKLDADAERYEIIREQRRAAINSRWKKERSKVVTEDNESIQPYTEEYERIRNIPTTTTSTTATATTNPTANPKTDSDNKGYKEKEGAVNQPYTPPPSLDGMDKLLEEIEQRRAAAHDV